MVPAPLQEEENLPDEEIAYHEAGHMVAAWDLGLSVLGATVVPDSDSLGHVLVPFEDRVRYADWVDEEGYLEAFLVTYLAGVAAHEKYTGVPTPEADVKFSLEDPGSDHYNAGDLISSLAGNDPDTQEEVHARAQRHARFLVEGRWEQVETVAAVLLERETLDEGQCRQALKDAFRS